MVQLVAGDAAAIRSSSLTWSLFGSTCAATADDLRRLDAGDFVGDEADIYRQQMSGNLPPKLETVGQAWNVVASALIGYTDVLETLQARLITLAGQAAAQQDHIDSATAEQASCSAADANHDAARHADLAALKPGQDPPADSYRSSAFEASARLSDAERAHQATVDAANQLHAEHDAAVARCVAEIDRARGLRFAEPPGFWGRLSGSVVGWVRDHADVLLSISSVLKQVSGIAAMLAFIPGMAAVAAVTAGVAVGIDTGVKLATGRGSWAEIAMDAASIIPGGRGVRTAVHGAESAVRDTTAELGAARVSERITPDELGGGRQLPMSGAGPIGEHGAPSVLGPISGNGASSTSGSAMSARAHATSVRTPVERRTCASDPVDVVTGEVVLSQTDVDLPGVLPLSLRRTHVSSYRWGGIFGASWASTLDQRIEIDQYGTCFVAEDGSVLYYPASAGEEGVLPSCGPRCWPLRTVAGGGWSVRDPDTGVTRAFAAADAAGVGRINEITDRFGNWVRFCYDRSGIVCEVSHSGGYRVRVDSVGGRIHALSLITDDGPIRLIQFGSDGIGNLTSVTNSSGIPLRMHYDEEHRLTGWADRNGIDYAYTYDELGRCIATHGRGRVLSYGFAYAPGRTTVTDSLGATSIHRIDGDGRIAASTDPLGRTTSYTFDQHDNLLTRTDPFGRTTQTVRDGCGRPIRVIHPDGTTTTADRDELGNVMRLVGRDGAAQRFGYDRHGALTAVTDPMGATTHFEHERGTVTRVIDPVGACWETQVDRAGLPIATTDPVGAHTKAERDAFGRMVRLVDASGAATTMTWTLEGRPATRRGRDGALETWTWDGEGNLVAHTIPGGATTRVEIGVFDLPVARTGPDGATHRFGYDTELRLTTVSNPAGLTWTYTYDSAGQLTGETDFNGRVQTYCYDPAGRLVELQRASGPISLTYDLADNLVLRATPDGDDAFFYDRAGRLLRAEGHGAHLRYDRDQGGRVIAEHVDGRTLRTSYDAAGRVISRTTPAGIDSTWDHDTCGLPAALALAGRTLYFTHDVLGRETRRSLDRGAIQTSAWDQFGLLTSTMVTPNFGTAVALVDRSYRYRPDGALAELHDTMAGDIRRLDCDAAGRIVAVKAAEWSESYGYHPAGPLTSSELQRPYPAKPAESAEHTHRGTLSSQVGDRSYTHDADGRTLSRTQKPTSGPGSVARYTYDALDRMTDAWTVDGAHWTYRYDPLGRRTHKTGYDASGELIENSTFTWAGNHLAETTTSGTITLTWEYQPGTYTPIAQIDTRISNDGAVRSEFHAVVTDHIGTPTHLITPDGHHVAWTAPPSTIWGQPVSAGGPTAAKGPTCPLRFPGQYADLETGLNYNHHRYYDPATSRYTTTDPLGLTPAPDPHAYVSNPTRSIDPLGLAPCSGDAFGGQPALVYRSGSLGQRNLTPRPGKDRTGLSAWDSFGKLYEPGNRILVIDTARLKLVRARLDIPYTGHVSILPVEEGMVEAWAATREEDALHPYAADLLDAVIKQIRVKK